MTENEDVPSILVIGEEGSGKTSLLNTLVSDRFIECDSEYIKHPIFCETLNGSAYFLDSLDYDQDLMANATGLILVVDITQIEELHAIWLERLRDIDLPLVLVLNKIDLIEEISPHVDPMEFSIENHIADELEAFQSAIYVHKVIRASAKSFQNVRDVFQASFESVHYPVTAIYDVKAKQLRTNFKKVVARFFRLADQDRDGFLSRSELSWCQKFLSKDHSLSSTELDRLMESLHIGDPCTIFDGKISLPGFYRLFNLFVEKQKLNNIFKLLKKLGYSRSLTFSVEAALPNSFDKNGKFDTKLTENLLRPRSSQLTPASIEHLNFLFDSYKINDRLPLENFEKIMFPVIQNPFGQIHHDTVEISRYGMSQSGFLSLFHVLADQKPSAVLSALLQTGMSHDCDIDHFLEPKPTTRQRLLRAAVLGTDNQLKRELLTTLAGNICDKRSARIPTRTTFFQQKDTCLLFENFISNNRKHLERLIVETSWKKYDAIVVYITDEASVNMLSELCEKFKKRQKKTRPQVISVIHVDKEIHPKIKSRIDQWRTRNGLREPWVFRGEFESLVSRLRKISDVPSTPQEISQRRGFRLFERAAICVSAAVVLGIVISKKRNA